MIKSALSMCSLIALAGGIASSSSSQTVTGAALPGTQPAADPAQSSADAGDIIVTAQRREQSLMKVPVAISAVGGPALEKAGIVTAVQLINTVPNLNFSGGYGRAQPNFYIRGIGADVAVVNISSPVGIYLDDAYMSNRINNSVPFFDTERVEVLRGPQGTLFGRNTVGGLVNVISKRPTLEGTSGYAGASYGNFNSATFDGALDTTIIPGKLGVRVAGTYSRNDGYFKNVFPGGRDPLEGYDYGLRAAALYQGDNGFKAYLKGYYGQYKHAQVMNYTLGTLADNVNPVTGYTRTGLDDDKVDSDTLGTSNIRSYGLLLTLSMPLSDQITVSSLTSRDWAKWNYLSDVDGSPVRELEEVHTPRTRQFNQEVKATVDLDRLSLVIGGYYGDDLVKYGNGLNFGTFGFSQYNFYNQARSSKALFAQGDYKITDKLTATIGFRYTWDRIRVSDGLAYIADLDGNILSYTLNGPTGPFLPTLVRKDSAPTGRAALTYTADDGHIFYISYGRGYRQGAFNGTIYTPDTAVFTKAETVDTYEFGSKGQLFGGLRYTAATFYTRYTNQQASDIQPGGTVVTRNNGTSNIYGAEFELFGRLAENLQFTGSLGLLRARYTKTILAGVDISGNHMPFAPGVNGRVGIDYIVPNIAGGDVTFSPAVSFRNKAFFSPYNNGPSSPTDTFTNFRLHQNGYALVDMSVSWEKGPILLRASARNLLDKRYYSAAYNVRGLGFEDYNYGDPRLYSLSARYAF